MNRIRIIEYGGAVANGVPTVVHWQLHFDNVFLCDTSDPKIFEKFKELQQLVTPDTPI